MASDEATHHHGETIRAYRVRRGLTQARLAERWPGGGVSAQYVQRVETGKKHIADPQTLRELSELLGVPLWRFGLSEYDPFHPHHLPGLGLHMYGETLDAIECLIRQTWELRRAGLMPQAEETLRRLNSLFGHFQRELPPPGRLETRFLSLYAQTQRLNAVAAVERRAYGPARERYEAMRRTASRLGDPTTEAIALMSMGSELARAGERQAGVEALERARDIAFRADKATAAFVHSYLARAYAMAGEEARFERAIETARTLAEGLGATYGDGANYIYAGPSSVLAEMSWGYLLLDQPQRTLELAGELARQATRDRDRRLRAWIPLDWTRAHLRLGNLEAAVAQAERFLRRVMEMESAHALQQARALVGEFSAAGYAQTASVRAYTAAVRAASED